MKRLNTSKENQYIAHHVRFKYLIGRDQKKVFYQSPEWKALRKFALEIFKNECFKCGSCEEIQVDHISPISIKPWLALHPKNIQLLCKKCNESKSNKNSDRFSFKFKFGEFVTPTKEILDNVEKYLTYFPKLEKKKRVYKKRYDLNKLFPSTL